MSFLVHQLLDSQWKCYQEIYQADNFIAQVNKSYVVNADKAIDILLPKNACVQDTISIRNIGNYPFSIVQGEGQQIQVGNTVTTFGINGKITLDELGSIISLECVLEDSSWVVTELNANALIN